MPVRRPERRRGCSPDESLIRPIRLELYPTWSAVGLELAWEGDADRNATAAFRWRRAGEPDWRPGVELTYDRQRRLAWASIWPLEQGERLEVLVEFADSGAERITPLSATVQTRRLPLDPQELPAVYVSPEGDDAGPGTREAPWRTLAHAAGRMAAGGVIYALDGVYHEGELFAGLKGTAERPLVIAAAPEAFPVLDGSVELAGAGSPWQEAAEGVYRTAFRSPTGYLGYLAQDGERMYLCHRLETLLAGRGQSDWGEPYELERAWHYDSTAGQLYLRPGDGTHPRDHDYNLAVHRYGARLEGSRNVVLRGFELRHYGEAGVGLLGGASDCIVLENIVHNSQWGIVFRGDSTCGNAIWNNEVFERGLTDFSWNAIKGSDYGRQGIEGKAGRGNSICRNRVHGWFDGIVPESWRCPDQLELNRDMDLMYNLVYNVGDDAFEVDGGGVNMRAHGNIVRNAFAAFSLAPVERGPVYFTRNDASYYLLMFKLNVGGCTSLGWAYCYHNSGWCLTRGKEYGGTAISFPLPTAIPISNKAFKNNAFICDGIGVRFAHAGYLLENNCYWPVPDAGPLRYLWQEQAGDSSWVERRFERLTDFSAATGGESRGLEADPLFAATPGLGAVERVNYGRAAFSSYPQLEHPEAAGDLRLAPGSPCIDAGEYIPGINDDFLGRAPDIGAHEFDSSPQAAGTKP